MKNLTILLLVVFVFFGCNKASNSNEEDKNRSIQGAVDSPTDTKNQQYTQKDQDNNIRLIQLTMKDLYSNDIAEGWMDSLSRQFKYDQVDLNEDGNLEIIVGTTGPYFCGSGGCTLFLLTHQGDVITQFSVTDYPVYVASSKTADWYDLVLLSNGKNYLMKFQNGTYPENPSIQPEFSGDLEVLIKKLNWANLKSYKF